MMLFTSEHNKNIYLCILVFLTVKRKLTFLFLFHVFLVFINVLNRSSVAITTKKAP